MSQAQPRRRIYVVDSAAPTVRPDEQLLRDYAPRSCLVTTDHHVTRSKFPSIDAHNHLGRWLSEDHDWAVPDVAELVDVMDACNVRTVVNLDGLWGDELELNLERYDRAHPGRFATFCQLERSAIREQQFPELVVASLERSVAAGARGLKVWKDLGLTLRDARGNLVLPDDERLDALWKRAGELDVPVLVHTADPVAFFQPADRHNERLEELIEHPDWHFADPSLPTFDRLIAALEQVVADNPRTTFIGAHVGCYPENLDWVHGMLLKYPNFNVDISARISELGRQPRAARRLVYAHPDRVLFGTDLVPLNIDDYRIYFRFLETADEYFSYCTTEVPTQGRWAISALALGDDVLRGVYHDNAARLLKTSPLGDFE